MLYHLATGAGNDKAGGGRDIKRVFAVATGANDVDSVDIVEIYRQSAFQDSVAKARKLVGSDASHQKYGHESRQLGVVESAVGYFEHYLTGFVARQVFVLKHFI
jgi:hypothetical protein